MLPPSTCRGEGHEAAFQFLNYPDGYETSATANNGPDYRDSGTRSHPFMTKPVVFPYAKRSCVTSAKSVTSSSNTHYIGVILASALAGYILNRIVSEPRISLRA